MKPNFLVIGAMKSATTSLCDIFAQHPQIFVSNPKELNFFCRDEYFARGEQWYEGLFAGTEGKIAVGEGSTSYTKWMLHPACSERVARHLPEAKLIYIVRHPLKRIESHWLHLIAAGEDVPPLRHALQKWPHIVDTSLYWKQISAYRRFFPDGRILVLFTEDLAKEPDAVLNLCWDFLGVDGHLAEETTAKTSHISAQARMDGPVIRAFQHVPGARAVKKLVPGLAHSIMPFFRRPLPRRPEWPADLKREVTLQLADDAATFLTFYGKPSDFWRFE